MSMDGKFSLSSAWDMLRSRGECIGWAHVAWHAKAIPRHSFIVWMLYSRRLCTRDRLINWGMIDSNECVFCGAEHLFFECGYSACIWRHVLQRMNKYRAVKGWSFESDWYSTEFKGKSFSSLLGR
ncbi:hypothetical protein LIER_24681 [Lithospermum erythrorhizon]|uniref:Reverse transcriptase zinc-binding domain-containing protein n=1 Tax=Lithospermum erythrorhizon TaxID=34254 RepID=A0AAV3R6A4_LITER